VAKQSNTNQADCAASWCGRRISVNSWVCRAELRRPAVICVGNYGEYFERTVGRALRWNWIRGENRQWTDGG